MKYQKRHKVAKALRHKGKEKCSVPLCLSAPMLGYGVRQNRRTSVPDNKGFTLMELMVVVAIMGILIIASMPVFREFARGRNLKEGANMVASALRKSREAAITYRKNYRTVLDTVNQAVGIYLNESGQADTIVEKWERLPELVGFDKPSVEWCTGTGGVNRYKDDYNAEQKVFWIQFKPSGAADGVGAIEQTVVLKEESTGDTRIISVNALTGKIWIE